MRDGQPTRAASLKFLQVTVFLAAFVPVLAGLAGVIQGAAMLRDESVLSVSLDSHFRYLSALLLGIGLGFWSTIPALESKTARFQLLSAIVVLGGFARLYAWLSVGMPDHSMLFGLCMELIVTPLLALWQYGLARRLRQA